MRTIACAASDGLPTRRAYVTTPALRRLGALIARMACVFSVLGAASGADAQVIRGRVVEADGQAAAANVSIVVHDATGARIARSQTSDGGAFSIRLGSGGRFRLRALRIGYVPTDTSIVVGAPDDSLTLWLVLSPRRVVLQPVKIVGRSSCGESNRANEAVIGVWEHVSAALDATTRGELDSTLAVETISYTLERSLRGGEVRQAAFEPPTWRRGGSFRSAAAAELVERGFLRTKGEELEFLAPDAVLLVDSAFTNRYCLTLLAGSADRPTWQGIAFRHPQPPSGLITIEGALWVDAEARLQRLEFEYRGLPREVERVRPGGVIAFQELPNRQWIVSRWHLRMARTSNARRTTGLGPAARVETVTDVLGVTERGGVAVRSRMSGGRPRAVEAIPASIRVDGGDASPGTVAVWWLDTDGTSVLLPQDERGNVQATRLVPGPNRFALWTAQMRSLGMPPDTTVLSLHPDGDSLRGVLRAPDEQALAARLCPASRGALAVGTEPAFGQAALRLSRSADNLHESHHYRMTTSRSAGKHWIACGLPTNERLVLWSDNAGRAEVHTRFRIPAGVGIALVSGNVDIAPPTANSNGPARRQSILVLSARDSTPLRGVTVVVDDTHSFSGDQRGVVRISLRPGAHQLLIRQIGFAPKSVQVDSGRTIPDTAFLDAIPAQLDEVVIRGRRIVASARYTEVLRRAASSGGTLFTREDFAGTRDLRTVFSQIPGVQLTDRGIAMQRCEGGMPSPGLALPEARIQVYIDGVRVTGLRVENAVMEAFRLVHPRSIEFVEVYRGVAQIPVEFLNDACAVIAIWTKSY